MKGAQTARQTPTIFLYTSKRQNHLKNADLVLGYKKVYGELDVS